MTPPIIWYTDHDGIAVPTDSPPPGAAPYMLARQMPIETAPRDGTAVLIYDPSIGWMESRWNGRYWVFSGRPVQPTHWLPLPPAPEEA